MQTHYQILIVGGGNAGISVASQLLRKQPSLEIAIIDPAEYHYYQPAWTLVGGGQFDVTETRRKQADVMPDEIKWIQDAATGFDPEQHQVYTKGNGGITYDYMVVAPGIQLDWHKVEGLEATLGKNGVTSNYHYDIAPYTWETIRSFKGGTALFTSPGTPVKCGGAPQKIMYLASDQFMRKGILSRCNVEFCNAGKVIFGVKKYARTLLKVVERYGIKLNFRHDLVKIDGNNKEAIFKVTKEDGSTELVQKSFDMIHITPPQSAPDFIKSSPLANEAGWVNVHKHSLQHVNYPNIFGIGDATSTPNAKTGAAIRKQAPVLVENLLAQIQKQPLPQSYNGYGSCPLVTGVGKLILAEFDYNNVPTESFPFDQAQERFSMYQLKKNVLPWMYWNKILKGTA